MVVLGGGGALFYERGTPVAQVPTRASNAESAHGQELGHSRVVFTAGRYPTKPHSHIEMWFINLVQGNSPHRTIFISRIEENV